MVKPTSSTAAMVPTPDSWKENLFISEAAIIARYQAEKQLGSLVLNGDYKGAKALLDSMPREQEYYQDFVIRTKDAVERQRQLALIMNSGMRMTMLNTNVPVTVIHGIATYFGRTISEADAETLFSNALNDAILITYCSLVQEFGRKSYSPAVEKIVDYVITNIAEHLIGSTTRPYISTVSSNGKRATRLSSLSNRSVSLWRKPFCISMICLWRKYLSRSDMTA